MGPDLTVGETVHGYRVQTVETDDRVEIRLAQTGTGDREGTAEITRAITARASTPEADTDIEVQAIERIRDPEPDPTEYPDGRVPDSADVTRPLERTTVPTVATAVDVIEAYANEYPPL